jgi:hypothetical protein
MVMRITAVEITPTKPRMVVKFPVKSRVEGIARFV